MLLIMNIAVGPVNKVQERRHLHRVEAALFNSHPDLALVLYR